MWYYIIGLIITCPIILKKYLVHNHNKRMIEMLKELNQNENAIKQPIIQKYTHDIIKLLE
jgi:hypothetical protein